MAPLRKQEFRELCGEPGCNGFAVDRCRRCRRPICADHVARPWDFDKELGLCESCEAEWEQRHDEVATAIDKSMMVRGAITLIAWFGGMGALALLRYPLEDSHLPDILICVWAVGALVVGIRHFTRLYDRLWARARRRFMRERAPEPKDS